MRRADPLPRDDAGLTLIEVLIATVILAFGSVAVVGALGTLSSGSGINRVQSSVASVVRGAAETIKLAAYIPCTNGGSTSPAFVSSPGPPVVYGYTTQNLGGPVTVPNDPPNNPPSKPTVTAVTNQNGQPLVGCSSDPGLQLVTVQDKSTDGKIIASLTVTKNQIDHTPIPAITPTVVGKASVASIVIGSTATDSVTVSGTSGTTPTGLVHFYICGPEATVTPCTIGTSNFVDLGTVSLSGAGAATSAPYAPTAIGTWCFLVNYLGDLNYNANSDATVTQQCVAVTPQPTQPAFPFVVSGTAGGPGPPPPPPNALQVMGPKGKLAVNGPIVIASTANKAVAADTAGDMSAQAFDTANATPSATCTGPGCALLTWSHLSPPSDPNSTLIAPTTQGAGSCTANGSTATCTPGTYSADPGGPKGAIGAGVTSVVFQPGPGNTPGIYLFSKGLTLGSGAAANTLTVTGSNILFYIAQGNAMLTPASWNVSPPSSGTYKGIFLFQGSGDNNTVTIGGNSGTTPLGMVYVPGGAVQFNGGKPTAVNTLNLASLWAEWVTVGDNLNLNVG